MAETKDHGGESSDELTTSAALSEEFRYLWGDEAEAVEHDAKRPKDEEQGALYDYYKRAFAKEQAALCLSGGGIRSAAFALGVMQALARKGLLSRFHYLSTVSGGGYIGGWLSRWIRDQGGDAAKVIGELKASASASLREPRQITLLRERSNFLTPKLGFASTDTWTAIALSTRNLMLNWLVFGPALLLVTLAANLYVALIAPASAWPAPLSWFTWPLPFPLVVLAIGIVCLAAAVMQASLDLPSHRPGPATDRNYKNAGAIDASIVTPSLAWAFLLPAGLLPWILRVPPETAGEPPPFPIVPLLLAYAAMLAGYFLAWGRAKEDRLSFRANLPTWMLASAVSTLALAVGVYLIRNSGCEWSLAKGVKPAPGELSCGFQLDVLATLGPLWVTLSHLLLSAFYVGFRKLEGDKNRLSPDLDREWLARLSAAKLRPALAWTLMAAACLLLPRVVFEHLRGVEQWIAGVVASISGVVSVFGGKSALSSLGLTAGSERKSWTVPIDWVIGVATIIFAAALLLLFARSELHLAGWLAWKLFGTASDVGRDHWLWAVHFGLGIVVGFLLWHMSKRINVNRFSLHGLYRNRLTRAFLGAGNSSRKPDPFTDLDMRDNARMHALTGKLAGNKPVLLHVVNVALNLVGGDRLAWQERKAESFTISPLACGSALLDLHTGVPGGTRSAEPSGAYIRTALYAGDEHEAGLDGYGISLGSALTISGAAASPSMGYHSSPATAFLMTLFNVRLGAWLPNPARAKDLGIAAMKHSGPRHALHPLLDELLGRTDDKAAYVYLSDGGHFENLGLYEMVRRRCRYIVVSDAGSDPNCCFEDLGNAVRKIRIDQNVQITFEIMRIASRQEAKEAKDDVEAFAVGTIRYPEQPPEKLGYLLYIKPSYFDVRRLPMDVRSYGLANESFPHETTGDQWFSESQFESYRRLGEFLVSQLPNPKVREKDYGSRSLDEFFEDLMNAARMLKAETESQEAPTETSLPAG